MITQQHHDAPNAQKESVVLFLSRKTGKEEMKYHPTELEFSGICWTLRKIYSLVYGCAVTLYTDHLAVAQRLFDFKHTSVRLRNLSLELQAWRNYLQCEYLKGSKHVVDALSRYNLVLAEQSPCFFDSGLFNRMDVCETMEKLVPPVCEAFLVSSAHIDEELVTRIKSELTKDPKLNELVTVFRALQDETVDGKQRRDLEHRVRGYSWQQGLLFRGDESAQRMCIPSSMTNEIIKEAHSTMGVGHVGSTKVIARLSQYFSWPRMARQIRQFVSQCAVCQKNKSSTLARTGGAFPLEVPTQRWTDIAMDFCGPFVPDCLGRDYLLVVICRLTKRLKLLHIDVSYKVPEIAREFVKHVVSSFGIPASIVSDRDPKFCSAFWRELFRILGTQLRMSTVSHPQTDGQSERTIRTITQMFRTMDMHDLSAESWETCVRLTEFAYNSSFHMAIGMTPFEADIGRNPAMPLDHLARQLNDSPENIREFIEHMGDTIHRVKSKLADARHRMLRLAKPLLPHHAIKVGDLVLVSTKIMNIPINSVLATKLQAPFIGPFKVIAKVHDTAFRLELPALLTNSHDVVNLEHVKRFYPDPNDAVESQLLTELPTDALQPAEYAVESILAHRRRGGGLQFQVKWIGYEKPTWERRAQLKHLDVLKEYEEQRKINYRYGRAFLAFQSHASKAPGDVRRKV